MSTTDREAIIIKQFQRGDTEAVQYIYKTFYRPLVYFADKLVGDKAEAEDIAIDCILRLFEKKQDFDSLNNIKAWLYISVRNACFDFLRAVNRHDLSHREIFYLTPQGEEQSDYEMITARVLQEIYQQVESLPPQCREIFKLLFFMRKSTTEIAGFMGISTQTVLNQKAKAIRLLRTALLKKELLPTAIGTFLLLIRP